MTGVPRSLSLARCLPASLACLLARSHSHLFSPCFILQNAPHRRRSSHCRRRPAACARRPREAAEGAPDSPDGKGTPCPRVYMCAASGRSIPDCSPGLGNRRTTASRRTGSTVHCRRSKAAVVRRPCVTAKCCLNLGIAGRGVFARARSVRVAGARVRDGAKFGRAEAAAGGREVRADGRRTHLQLGRAAVCGVLRVPHPERECDTCFVRESRQY